MKWKNKNKLRKMLTEFSDELGITNTKNNTNKKLGITMLIAASGVVGVSLIRGLTRRVG